MRKLATLLTIADIVRMRKESGMTRGISRYAVRRWLLRLNRRCGGRLLVSRNPLTTTLSLLMRADPRWLEEGRVAKDDVAFLKRRLREVDLRVSALGARVRELQKAVELVTQRLEAVGSKC